MRESLKQNIKGGDHALMVSKLCVTTFGPHREIFDKDGHAVQQSKKGHPLGGSRHLYLPPHLHDEEEDIESPCEAARYAQCTVACCLCRGL